MYVLYKLKYTYISKHNESTKIYALRHVAQRMYMYSQQFGQDGHIHEVKHKHKTMKQIQKWEYKFKMHESSKLDYTSTSNGFK